MRTCAGYLFTCKECGYKHLLDGEPHDGIVVPCACDENKSNSYKKKDFTFWHGFRYNVWDVIVEEIK